MKRRHLLAGIAAATLCRSRAALAQGAARMPRVGVLSTTPLADSPLARVLLQELRTVGWIEGKNLIVDWKVTAGEIQRFEDLAAELVRSGADVIVAPNPNAVFAARRATASIPIVMVNTPDPVQLGIVASLSRPGGNVTGTSSLSAEISAKQVQLLTELLPGLSELSILSVVTNPWHPTAIAAIEAAARTVPIGTRLVVLRDAGDFERAFAGIARGQGALVLTDPVTYFHRSLLAELGLRHGVPTAYGLKEYAEAGGLMSYWADHEDLYRRTAAFVDKLLKGEKPGDLPIEQPTKYELVLNLRTAKALGIDISPAMLARVDEVLE